MYPEVAEYIQFVHEVDKARTQLASPAYREVSSG